jgi:cytosine/adenosine deaminase-related metal-dependent hydrolase
MPDIVVHDATLLTVDERNRLFERGTLVVEDGTITEVRSTGPDDTALDADHVIDGDGTLVMPGLVNAHTHLELTPLLGAFSDLDLLEMMGSMTAVYTQFADGEFDYLIEAGYELAAYNFLAGGITTINTMDVRPGVGVETVGAAGLRGFLGPAISDLFWDRPVDEQFERAREFVETHHDTYGGRIRATICPHDDWSCTRELWERTADFAAEYPDLLVHTHLLELDESDRMARANGGADSTALLSDVGLLDDRLVAAHFRIADEVDIRRTAEAGAGIAHCPSVFCYWNPDPSTQWTPVPELRAAGVDVGLGLDDHYWHDSYNLFGEARQARLAANLERGTGQFQSIELLRMLTVDGARALSVGDEIGSLEPGKRADFLVLDVDTPKFAPRTNLPAQVVNQATPADVETVVVDGEFVVEDGTPTRLDGDAVQQRAEAAVERFVDETGWDLDVGGGDPPGTVATARDIHKRGPARLLSRLAIQSAKDRFSR